MTIPLRERAHAEREREPAGDVPGVVDGPVVGPRKREPGAAQSLARAVLAGLAEAL